MTSVDIFSIHKIMLTLGIPSNYIGFFYTSFAVYLSAQDPTCLNLVTKLLYPDIAKHFHTDWRCVEHNIRTIIKVMWQKNPDCLDRLANRHLISRPTASEFISYLTSYYTSVLHTEN